MTNGPLLETDCNGQIPAYPQATTNPVWVLVGHRPVRSAESARYFIRRIAEAEQVQ